MSARAYLFVPGDAPRKMEKAAQGPADAIILDLEDSVSPDAKDAALDLTCAFLRAAGETASARYWVRLNATEPARALRELVALPLGRIAGLVVPKLSSLDRLAPLAHALDALEARDGLPAGAVGLIGIVTETAAALLTGADLGRGHPRLRGYCWGIEDLSADIGRAQHGQAPQAAERLSRLAQEFCLMVATAAGIDAIDGVDTRIEAVDAIAADARLAADLGFRGKLAIHPAQIAPLQAAFTPDADSLAWARRVLALAQDSGASAFRLDGRMIDRPHIEAARRLLARARPA
ncbi:CoA ester lyase [Xanthobacter sp. V3C-3]|uniref:HpcH/HpaI aldolase/citrate lyase family protein n=1 Tax=Xanthobacter lutulentifluminis TaxID=3119935 RepID=UPI00372BD455